jgi:hypothetical protein
MGWSTRVKNIGNEIVRERLVGVHPLPPFEHSAPLLPSLRAVEPSTDSSIHGDFREGLLAHSVILRASDAKTRIIQRGRNKSEIPQTL